MAPFATAQETGIYNVTGTYSSRITGSQYKKLKAGSREPEVSLVQNGNQITGSYGTEGSTIEGVLVGTQIKFRWRLKTGGAGFGVWHIVPGTNRIKGSWQSGHTGEGKWDLTLVSSNVAFAKQPGIAPQPVENELIKVSTGSGFAVSREGHIITNNHVISGCNYVNIRHQGESFRAKVLYRDAVNDLAVIQGEFEPARVFRISRRNPQLLQDVFVAGYPFDQLSTSIKVTKGIVSSLAGVGNNTSNIQVDAALQPGNSGGPIIDDKGNVIAVAVAKLDLEKIVKDWGVVPENTNFGIKSYVVANLLESNGIAILEASTETMPNAELGALMTGGTYNLSCYMTLAQIRKMIETKVMFDDVPQ